MKTAYRPPLQAAILFNVRSLHNKIDELSTIIRYDGNYRRACLFCFTETWLSELNADIDVEAFTIIRFDRDTTKTKICIGCGLCMLVNKKWPTYFCVRERVSTCVRERVSTNFCVRERVSTRLYEILTVSFWPHYLPLEFGQVTVVLTYIPGPGNAQAAQRVAES